VRVSPRPELRPFFDHIACQNTEEIALQRKRRGSDTQVRTEDDQTRLLLIAAEAVLGGQVRPCRRRRSDTKLDATARAALRAEKAKGRSLRELALAFGVSHQTISTILGEDTGSQAA
jgi:hypothetical protein